jgi:hypothetical protein
VLEFSTVVVEALAFAPWAENFNPALLFTLGAFCIYPQSKRPYDRPPADSCTYAGGASASVRYESLLVEYTTAVEAFETRHMLSPIEDLAILA